MRLAGKFFSFAVLMISVCSAQAFASKPVCTRSLLTVGVQTKAGLLERLQELQFLARMHASAKTAYDSQEWKDSNDPLTSHCGALAFCVQELFGGSILSTKIGSHRALFNVLESPESGKPIAIDLTRGQYNHGDYRELTALAQTGKAFLTSGNPKMKKILKNILNTNPQILIEYRRNKKIVGENKYPLDRGITKKGTKDQKSYSDFFTTASGELLLLNSLKAVKGTWLDVGSGELFGPQEFFQINQEGSVLAVNAHQPKTRGAQRNLRVLAVTGEQFKLSVGHVVEDIPLTSFPKNVEVITDVYGALSYSPFADVVLNKYLKVLKTGGEIFFVIREESLLFENEKSLLEVLQQTREIKVTQISERGYRIQKLKKDAHVGHWQLVHFSARDEAQERWVPQRIYREN